MSRGKWSTRGHPVFQTQESRAAFLSIPTDGWICGLDVDATKNALDGWFDHGFVDRISRPHVCKRPAHFYRRRIDLPAEAMIEDLPSRVERAKGDWRAARSVHADAPKQMRRRPSDADLNEWVRLCRSLRSLGALCGVE